MQSDFMQTNLKKVVFPFAVFFAFCFLAGCFISPLCAQAPAVNPMPPSTNQANARDDAQDKAQEKEAAPSGFMEIVFSGGITGMAIILLLVVLSIAGLALAVDHWMTIQERKLMPENLAPAVSKQIAAGNLAGAIQACDQHPSVLAFVLKAGLSEVDGGWAEVEKGMEDAAAEQSAKLLRKVEYLSVLGNIAPMVGLLGTVIGMIFAFQEVANTQGAARASELASGIYQALVTTVGGLLVAIPSLGAHAVFRNRIDQYIAETAYKAQHTLLPIKRARRAKQNPPAPPVEG